MFAMIATASCQGSLGLWINGQPKAACPLTHRHTVVGAKAYGASHELLTFVTLRRTIARELGIHRQTVRKYVDAQFPGDGP